MNFIEEIIKDKQKELRDFIKHKREFWKGIPKPILRKTWDYQRSILAIQINKLGTEILIELNKDCKGIRRFILNIIVWFKLNIWRR